MKTVYLVFLFSMVFAIAACGKADNKADAVAAPASVSVPGAADSGIALYPGMVALMEGHRVPVGNGGFMIDSAYKSSDKPEKVAAFYRDLLGKKFGSNGVADTPMGEGMVHLMAGAEGANQSLDITIRAEGDGTVVSIKTIGKSN